MVQRTERKRWKGRRGMERERKRDSKWRSTTIQAGTGEFGDGDKQCGWGCVHSSTIILLHCFIVHSLAAL